MNVGRDIREVMWYCIDRNMRQHVISPIIDPDIYTIVFDEVWDPIDMENRNEIANGVYAQLEDV